VQHCTTERSDLRGVEVFELRVEGGANQQSNTAPGSEAFGTPRCGPRGRLYYANHFIVWCRVRCYALSGPLRSRPFYPWLLLFAMFLFSLLRATPPTVCGLLSCSMFFQGSI
jgi:hypothetical protein